MAPKPLSKVMKSSKTPKHKEITPYALSALAGQYNADSKWKVASKSSSSSGKVPPIKKKFGGKLSKIEREAYEQGFASGEEAGRSLGMKKVENTRHILAEMIEEMDQLQMELLGQAEQDILAISLAVALRILGHEVRSSREVILSNINEAIKKIGQSDKIVVRLSPHDLGAITDESDRLTNLIKEGGLLNFEPDTNLSPGDCIVEGSERMVDARLSTQIQILTDALKKNNIE